MTTTQLSWADTYQRAHTLFGGQTPGRQLEADLIEKFEQHPQLVVDAIQKLGDRYRAGKITSPWPLILREVETAANRPTVTADPSRDRELHIRLAETYVRNAGVYDPGCVDALFEERGRLHPWRDDEALRRRIAELWHNEQARLERTPPRAPRPPRVAPVTLDDIPWDNPE